NNGEVFSTARNNKFLRLKINRFTEKRLGQNCEQLSEKYSFQLLDCFSFPVKKTIPCGKILNGILITWRMIQSDGYHPPIYNSNGRLSIGVSTRLST
ncbi:MAG: hypothetical protein ACI9ZD_001749, partial [Paracoccaceae bacterium]